MRRLHTRGAALLLALLLAPVIVRAQDPKRLPPTPVMPTGMPSVMPTAVPTVASGLIPAINGRVTSVRFYEGPYQGIPSAQRVYFSTFQRALTRYIYWQLDVAFPTLPGPVNLPLDAIWYRRDGSVFARQCDDTLALEAGWSTAWHTRGRGWDDFGNWSAGPYWVDLFILGDRVASGRFSVTDGTSTYFATAPTHPVSSFIPSLNARVTSVKFFEAGVEAPAKDQRSYESSFTRYSTRYVYWEMDLAFPYQFRRQNFNIEAIWYGPDGSIFTRQSDASFYVDQSWTHSDHTWGHGWDSPGQWNPGTYYVELFVNGTRVGYDRFIIGS